ncbi:MAG: hypothetical protein ACI33J_11250 [Clostridium sp.]
MKIFVILVFAIFLITVTIIKFMLLKNKKKQSNFKSFDKSRALSVRTNEEIVNSKPYETSIKFKKLPTLTKEEESHLMEVKDNQLIAKIDSVIPGTLQTIANTVATKKYLNETKSAGQLYQVIIPQGVVLDKSRTMEGAFRGSYRKDSNRIKGNANWIPFDNSGAKNLTKVNFINTTMSLASIVVGQYYMTQINNKLEDINDEIKKIESFQRNELNGKLYALRLGIQKSATFEFEIMIDDELKNRELIHLKSLEYKCTKLFGQANSSLEDIIKNKNIKYSNYENLTKQAEMWYKLQQITLDLMYKISDLSYVFNLGAISRENSNYKNDECRKQSEIIFKKLCDWHNENVRNFEINIEKNRRKRQGINGIVMKVFGLINDNLNYKKISNETVALIKDQVKGIVRPIENEDLFKKDVRLVAKEGKLYYLPEFNSCSISNRAIS